MNPSTTQGLSIIGMLAARASICAISLGPGHCSISPYMLASAWACLQVAQQAQERLLVGVIEIQTGVMMLLSPSRAALPQVELRPADWGAP